MIGRILAQEKMIPARQIARRLVQLLRRLHRFPAALRCQQRGIQMLFPVIELGGVVMVYGPVGQHADMPLVRPSGKPRFKPQAPTGQAVAFGIALKEKGVVKLDFAVRADVHADTEPHFFAAVLRVRAVKAEHRLQGAGALELAVQYFAGKIAGARRAAAVVFRHMGQDQRRRYGVERRGLPQKAVRRYGVARFRHGQAHAFAADRPAVARLADG